MRRRTGDQLVWQDLLAHSGTFFAFLTLGFHVYIDPARAISTGSHFLTRINRALFGKHFRAHGQWLSGVVVMERKRLSYAAFGSPHFHLLVRSPPEVRVNCSDLLAVARRQASRLRYPRLDPSRPMGRLISGPRVVDVRDVTNLDGLAAYLTKQIESLDAVNIGFFGPSGIEGIEC